MALRVRDLRALLAFVADAHDANGPEALTRELLDRLTELMGCEYATYETCDWPRRTMMAYVSCSNEDPPAGPPTDVSESFWRGDDPPRWGGGAFHKLSDWFDRPERERIRDEEEFNAEFRIVDTIGFRVGDRKTRSAWVAFDSQRRDFDERDRELALTLQPHVEALWRKTVSRLQAAELLDELERDDNTNAHAVVLFGIGGRIDHATASAQRLLAGWFGVADGHLPEELRDWLALGRPGERYTEERNGAILTVEAAGDFTLNLREHFSADDCVTPREREVLALVAEGLTNTEIGRRLWVAPSTVAKHLEQAYRKLGVHSRTAAVARIERLAD